ncbi:MAG: ABC transporter ATP-binding protein [Deltaproteobacteria bacterium]|nr:ABC transporter ATP-binding protein [Deltaproteobacteria bacterium]
MLRSEDIKKYYGDFCALDGVSIRVNPDEFVSIIGPNGAGKTTLVDVLTGRFKPETGAVYFKEKDITGIKPEKLCKLGVARSFQLVNIFPELTVHEFLTVAIISRLGRGTRLLSSLKRNKKINEETLEIARLFGLEDKKDMHAKDLPQGDKKLLDIASAFALHPEIIVLDEPTSGVSTNDKYQIIETLISASKEIGIRSILQIEHDMDIVFSYSDRIIALHQGHILAEGTPKEIQNNEQVVSMILGGHRQANH